ncbi:MAG TPA: TerC family protein [Terriglobales bacterium]|nr:TerC family protein [Terriglobales bacterium]
MQEPILFWVVFNAFVLLLLVLDLGIFQRRAHTIHFREAMLASLAWFALAGAFAAGVYWYRGRASALEFVTGYLVEESLSVDNLFVFLLIFRYFRVPTVYQHKVLFWGILGALVMRGVFIVVGVSLIRNFHWIIYVFGAFLVYTGFKLLGAREAEVDPEKNPVLRLVRRWLPVTPDFVGGKFWVRDPGLYATPLLLVLIVVETTDVLFAADSIPAVLAISHDPFIVYTSNVFAVLGLRSLYFALAGMMEAFHHLHYGLAVILMFIGAKMLASDHYHIHTGIALGVVAGVLVISIASSLLFPKKV